MTETVVRALLVDIEGTTTPVDFVYRTLFPFARARLRDFLSSHAAQVRDDLARLRLEREAEAEEGAPEWHDERRIDSAVAYLEWLMDRDRKSTALKALQGRIWETGYRAGALRGELYPDVAPAFGRWRAQGRSIAIFSSGSALAQRLIFGYSTAGDLTPMIEAYFDTRVGLKREAESYRRIAGSLALETAEALFISDVGAELDAAREAGMRTLLCVRDDQPPEPGPHPRIASFDEVFPQIEF
jgi:enolase-phosphatase E1